MENHEKDEEIDASGWLKILGESENFSISPLRANYVGASIKDYGISLRKCRNDEKAGSYFFVTNIKDVQSIYTFLKGELEKYNALP